MRSLTLGILILATLGVSAPSVSASNAVTKFFGTLFIKPEGATKPVKLYDRSHALVIGIDDYGPWPKLSLAVQDARKVAEELSKRGYEVTLLTSDKQKIDVDVLNRAFKKFLITGPGSNPQARLLIWFAGHGHSIQIPDTKDEYQAYLVGADAPLPPDKPADDWAADAAFQARSIPLQQFDVWMRQSRAKHIMSVFDSCFSGGIFARRSGFTPLIRRAVGLKVREFISSGQAGEEVSDDGQFRRSFLDAISGRDPRADQNGDGYVLGSELGQYLRAEVTNYSRGGQTPEHGKLAARGFNRGDFVFDLPSAPKIEVASADGSNTAKSGDKQKRSDKKVASAAPDTSQSCTRIGRRIPKRLRLRVGMAFCDVGEKNIATVIRIANRVVVFEDNGRELSCPQGVVCGFKWPVKPLFRITSRSDAARGIAPTASMLPR